MDPGPLLKQRLVSSKAAVVSHAAKSIDIDPSAAFTQYSLILAQARSRLCRGFSYLNKIGLRQMVLTEMPWNGSKSRAKSSSLGTKPGPAVSSTGTSLVACCVVLSVGVECPEEDGSNSGATRVSYSNASANMLFDCGSNKEEDFVAIASRGPHQIL